MIKQFINLPTNAEENQGSRINLEVEAGNLSDEDIARAEWWVEPVGSDNQDEKYLSRRARAQLRWPNTRNRRDKFINRLSLPHVGGDKYVVKCSKPGDRSTFVALEEIQTWRKLYYTVHYMNNDCRTFFNDLKTKFEAAFEEAFIELENVDNIQTLVDEAHTRSTNSLNHLYRRRPRLANRPFHLRLVVLNNIYESENNQYTVSSVGDLSLSFFGLIDHTTDKGLDPRRPIRSVHARRRGTRRWTNITRHATKTGDRTITIRVADHSRFDKNQDVDLRIRTRERDEYLGHSIGNFCCVRINESGTLAERKITVLQTLTHEVGHGCQQVVRRERLYNATGGSNGWEINAKWHTNNFGGQGPHCSINAKTAASTTTSSGQTYVWDSGTLCTMFFSDESHVDADGKFCTECKPRLARVNLGSRQMRRQGWGRY